MKRAMTACVMLILLMICPVVVFAETNRLITTLKIDGRDLAYNEPNITMVLNGQTVECKTMPPVLLDDFTYVPARDVFEFFGATVDWKGDSQEVYIGYKDQLIILQINNLTINANGYIMGIPVAPRLVSGKTMIPVRFASAALGFAVDWDPVTHRVYIDESMPEVSSPETTLPENTLPNGQNVNSNTTSNWENPSKNLPAIPKNMNTGSGSLSLDLSTQKISSENHPETSIVAVVPDPVSHSYLISAQSAISSINSFVLEDNRLVVDIINAKLTLDPGNYLKSPTPYLSGIRLGQNQQNSTLVTRVVFDLKSSMCYDILLSADRKNIIVRFLKNPITKVSFRTDGENDYLTIDGLVSPSASVFPLDNPSRIVVDLTLADMGNIPAVSAFGAFASGVRTSQFDPNTGRIVIDLYNNCRFSVSQNNNSTVVKLSKPSPYSFNYDTSAKTLIVSKTNGLVFDLNKVAVYDDYNHYGYYFELPIDLKIDHDIYNVSDNYLNGFEVFGSNGRSVIKINEKQVLAFDLAEDSENYYFRAMTPKQKYQRVVVIDPGHGNQDPGTTNGKNYEKDFNLDVGLRLMALLEADPTIKAYSTRISDEYWALDERAKFANLTGDMFVSIHHNAFDNPKTGGTETYFYPHANDTTVGLTGESLAKIAQKHMLAAHGLNDRGVKSARYVVLNQTTIPAILAEIAFLSNAEELEKMKSPGFSQKSAEALYKTIKEGFSIYTPKR